MRIALIISWTLFASAYAHATDLAQGLSSIPISNIIIAAVLSFIGGLAWTAQKEAHATTETRRLALTVFSDVLVSVVAGLITFFLLSIATDSALIQAALITTAGYGGTRIMDSYLSVLIDRVATIFRKST